ncbi:MULTISPECIES: outer membrane protein transport protein [unclassified Vibrio]|uniref:outer membrane protein transport protein n=1 Tax=unclassified Vibrio TaxID=2614977 RepID=UPI000C84FC17|nr:outer membrane protein transport protein [Vibrio sp. 10N.261.54.E10]PMK06357.1 aromatic hydrocarbon degradation protein [Vibrio sp. 10N.261.54.E10]
MKMNKTLLSAAVAVGLLSTSTVTHAAGFQLAEYSATGLGRAYAGEAAMADGADAQWRNPAMLTYLEGTQVSVGAIYVDPNIDIDGTSTPGGTSTPSSSSDFAHSAVIPNFYVSHKYNEKFALGFAAGTNYGMETDLGKDFGGANFGNEASVTSMELNLNAAYQVIESVSIGGGIRYVMAEGSFGAVSAITIPNAINQGDTLKYMEGDDTAWGWQIGTAWQINENNRLGFTYKSEVDLTLEGHAEGAGFKLPQGQKRNGSMDLALPATAELASFHQLTEKVAVHASINWTNWSSFKELIADFPTESVSIKEENWEDNYRFAIGTTYQMTPKLALRSGIAYDTSAVSEEHRTATIPETDRTWLSIGAGYQWSDQLTLDAGFTYILAKDAKMLEDDASSAPFGGTFEGEVTGSIWLVGIQANYRF